VCVCVCVCVCVWMKQCDIVHFVARLVSAFTEHAGR